MSRCPGVLIAAAALFVAACGAAAADDATGTGPIESFDASWDADAQAVVLSWRVEDGWSSGPLSLEPGIGAVDQGDPVEGGSRGGSVAVSVAEGGWTSFRAVLVSDDDPPTMAVAHAEVAVPHPAPVTPTVGPVIDVDPLEPEPVTIRWDHPDLGPGGHPDGSFVRVQHPTCSGWVAWRCRHDVDGEPSHELDLETVRSLGGGQHRFALTWCVRVGRDEVTAPVSGTVELEVQAGQPVGVGDLLAVVDPVDGDAVELRAEAWGDVVLEGGPSSGDAVVVGESILEVERAFCSPESGVVVAVSSVAVGELVVNVGEPSEQTFGGSFRIRVPGGEVDPAARSRISWSRDRPLPHGGFVAGLLPDGAGGHELLGTTGDHLVIDNAVISEPGVYEVHLLDCVFSAGWAVDCLDLEELRAPADGTLELATTGGSTVATGDVWPFDASLPIPVATVTDQEGRAHPLTLDREGRVVLAAAHGASVGEGDVLLYASRSFRTAQVVVGDPDAHEPQWEVRDWRDDFDAGASQSVPTRRDRGAGLPLDVLRTADGAVFSIGEFSSALAHVGDGPATAYEVPLHRDPVADVHSGLHPVTTPFGGASLSTLGERVIEVDGADCDAVGDAADCRGIWFTHGGGFLRPTDGNYSRIVQFDPQRDGGADPTTPVDERFCVYHVPTAGAEVIGVAWDGDRIWFAESAPSGTAALGAFDPRELGCDNLLDYDDPDAVAAAQSYCGPDDPDQSGGCIERIELHQPDDLPCHERFGRPVDDHTGFCGAAHLAFDPAGTALWFTEYYGAGLGRLDLATGELRRFPLPASARTTRLTSLWGSNPWQLRVDERSVFIAEFAESRLLRFDTAAIAAGDDGCGELDASGRNPCVDELLVPHDAPGVHVHSIELHDGALWFTVPRAFPGPGTPADSMVGWVDAERFDRGVLYRGLGTAPELAPPFDDVTTPAAFKGIAVGAGGEVVVADFARRQIVELVPDG